MEERKGDSTHWGRVVNHDRRTWIEFVPTALQQPLWKQVSEGISSQSMSDIILCKTG